jgi:hypothetical protein
MYRHGAIRLSGLRRLRWPFYGILLEVKMVEFFCPHCKQNTLDSFAVGFAHNRVLKCDFCMNKFRVSIVAVEQSVQATALESPAKKSVFTAEVFRSAKKRKSASRA